MATINLSTQAFPKAALAATADTTSTAIASGVGPKSVTAPPAIRCAPKTSVAATATFNPAAGIGSLTKTQIKALMVQIGYSESRSDYAAVGIQNQLGKYQFDTDTLVEYGYIHAEYLKTFTQFDRNGVKGAVKQLTSWTGKDGIKDISGFAKATALQESLMYQRLTSLYSLLNNSQAITDSDGVSTKMGMLYAAHRCGITMAKRWRDTGLADMSTSGDQPGVYYALGKYAGEVLAASTNVR